jgi:hypothetical protein
MCTFDHEIDLKLAFLNALDVRNQLVHIGLIIPRFNIQSDNGLGNC